MTAEFPRLFVARPDEAARLLSAERRPMHAVDAFRTGGSHAAAREWVVALDDEDVLRAWPEASRAGFPDPLPAELAWNEVAHPQRHLRTIDASRFHLFGVRLLEQPGDAPGLDDPVYLYGTMSGPWPSDAPHAAEGQLTVSRGDVLQGFVGCAPFAFHYAAETGLGAAASRCLHMLLAGGRDDETHAGEGIVLAYPMAPAGFAMTGAGNDLVAAHLLHDVLGVLQEDLVRNHSASPLSRMLLPVPSRMALEAQLEAQGYEIDGNVARRRRAGSGFSGFLASVFGAGRDELPLPQEASLDDFVRLAAQALSALPGWPSPRSAALGQRMAAAPLPPPQPRAPMAAPPAPFVAPPPTPPRPVLAPAPSANWMQDFMARRTQTSAQPPRVTRVDDAAPSGHRRAWMDDFQDPPRKPQDGDGAPPDSPGWMKDFQ